MLNKVWFALLLIGLLYGFGKAMLGSPPGLEAQTPAATATASADDDSRADQAGVPAKPPSRSEMMTDMGRKLTTAGLDAAKGSVEICIGLIGVMALWLGFMKIAEDAGLVATLAGLLRPLLGWLFPDIPKDHPAGGAIVMNMAANILGLDNAATPLGLKAMQELQTLNLQPDTATNSMAMFLAINTSSITLLPFTIIGYRASMGSADPAAPVLAMICATTCSTIAGVVACRFLQRFYPVPRPPTASDSSDSKKAASTGQEVAR